MLVPCFILYKCIDVYINLGGAFSGYSLLKDGISHSFEDKLLLRLVSRFNYWKSNKGNTQTWYRPGTYSIV